jgi:hypothetical protein
MTFGAARGPHCFTAAWAGSVLARPGLVVVPTSIAVGRSTGSLPGSAYASLGRLATSAFEAPPGRTARQCARPPSPEGAACATSLTVPTPCSYRRTSVHWFGPPRCSQLTLSTGRSPIGNSLAKSNQSRQWCRMEGLLAMASLAEMSTARISTGSMTGLCACSCSPRLGLACLSDGWDSAEPGRRPLHSKPAPNTDDLPKSQVQEKGLAAPSLQALAFAFKLWLLDLGSNQGPTD